MAFNYYFLSLLFLSTFSLLIPFSLSSPIFLPLSKHPHTHHHLTHLFHTPRLSPLHLLLDIDSPFLSLPSSLSNFSFPVPRRSLHCSAASSYQSEPLDSNYHCTVPLAGSSAGVLVKGVIGINHRASVIDDFVYVAAPSPSSVLGLGRNRVGVVEQVTHFFGLSKKFSLCLSSEEGNGVVLFGDNHSNSMVYTPILTGNDYDGSYRINLKSVRVRNKPIQLHQPSTIKFSTISPYTLVKNEIYNKLVKAFSAEAEATGMVRTKSVGQFKLCYDIKALNKVPAIDLVLQSEMVKWRINGENSMTKVSDKVMCLGILDGGEEIEDEIVLGSHQMEDNMVEFDLGRSMLGFSSLLKEKTSCSQLTSTLLHKHVQSL